MVSLYSTWWVKPGNEQLVAAALKQLSNDVKAHELGTLMYLVHSPLYDFPVPVLGHTPIISAPELRPGTIVFFEKYQSWAAFETHLYGPLFTNFVATFGSLFVQNNEGSPFVQVAFMQEFEGFIR